MHTRNRKQIRLQGYDYASNGCYFNTICTHNRKPLFWSQKMIDGIPRLSARGKVVKHWILSINNKYPHIYLDKFVIMPNHIHLLLKIDKSEGQGNPAPAIKTAMGWLKYHMTADINALTNTPGKKVFQRSYYDHIIRDEDDYAVRWEYIDDNINRWLDDEYYCN